MKVSLILATVGRTDEVGRCLRSLSAQTDSNFEVLLIDQNKDDRLLPHVQQALAHGMAITHLRPEKPSLSGARNLGIANATGELIGLTDDDCWYEPDAVARIRQAFLGDSDIHGIVACWVEQARAHSGTPATGQLNYESWRCFRGGDASSISLFFKRALFDRLGGFDERFGIGQWFGAGEETDFVLRALAAGAKVQHCQDAQVHHAFNTQVPGPWRVVANNLRKRARGTGGIYRKHRIDTLIVLRGLVAPVLLPLLRLKFKAALIGTFVTLGRVEGLLHWPGRGRP